LREAIAVRDRASDGRGNVKFGWHWAAAKEAQSSYGRCKPGAAETWVVPRPHQLERRLIVAKRYRYHEALTASEI